jgi:hypothetical protein
MAYETTTEYTDKRGGMVNNYDDDGEPDDILDMLNYDDPED